MRDDDPHLEPEDVALVAQLKALPPEGSEPDWGALEAAIRAEVGDEPPRPWWRNWRWIVPVWALATTTVIALVLVHHEPPVEPRVVEPARIDAGVAPPAAPSEEATAMWLDGQLVELDDVPGGALDDLDDEARAALAPSDDVTGGILPVADYGWIDTLDDAALARADDWLTRKKS